MVNYPGLLHDTEECPSCRQMYQDGVRLQVPVWQKEQWDACESRVPGVSGSDE